MNSALQISVVVSFLVLTGCRQDMHNQPRYEPLQPSTLFADGRASRPLVQGTVPRGGLKSDRQFYTGRRGLAQPVGLTRGAANQAAPQAAPQATAGSQPDASGPLSFDPDFVTEFPMQVTRQTLQRGQQRYQMFCTPCHGYTGDANGMIVQRGLSRPPSFHIARLRQAPVGHYFDVITNGFGAMYSYSSRIPVGDRWAIIAYVRALQLSQGATIQDVPENERGKIRQISPAGSQAGGGTAPPQSGTPEPIPPPGGQR
jgi:hypothetical protein